MGGFRGSLSSFLLLFLFYVAEFGVQDSDAIHFGVVKWSNMTCDVCSRFAKTVEFIKSKTPNDMNYFKTDSVKVINIEHVVICSCSTARKSFFSAGCGIYVIKFTFLFGLIFALLISSNLFQFSSTFPPKHRQCPDGSLECLAAQQNQLSPASSSSNGRVKRDPQMGMQFQAHRSSNSEVHASNGYTSCSCTNDVCDCERGFQWWWVVVPIVVVIIIIIVVIVVVIKKGGKVNLAVASEPPPPSLKEFSNSDEQLLIVSCVLIILLSD